MGLCQPHAGYDNVHGVVVMNAVANAHVTSAAQLPQLEDCVLCGRRVLIRADLNVPLHRGRIGDDHKIVAALPTIRFALRQGAAAIVLSHLGRPRAGMAAAELSLRPVAARLTELLAQPVRFEADCLSGIEVAPGQVVLCENVRFHFGETTDDELLSRQFAALGDVFVMDAFATAHRAHASTHGVIRHAACACAGLLFARELEALSRATHAVQRPLVAVVGGAKISTKLGVLETLINRTDCLVAGGGIANMLLAAAGSPIGRSLHEPKMRAQAQRILTQARRRAGVLRLPEDVVCARSPAAVDTVRLCMVGQVADDEMILDFGPRTRAAIASAIRQAATVFWNGPVGLFERPAFMAGTRCIAEAIAASRAYSVAGGGDTLAALDSLKSGVADFIRFDGRRCFSGICRR